MTTESKQRGLEEFSHPTLTREDIEMFCKGANRRFCYLGEPEDLGTNEVFRVGPLEWPSPEVTIKVEDVVKWKAANDLIGPQVTEGGVYRDYLGAEVTTAVEAHDTESEATIVVYSDQSGKSYFLPRDQFFRVVFHDDKHLPRFTYLRTVQPKK